MPVKDVYETVCCVVCGEETRRQMKDGRKAVFILRDSDKQLPSNQQAEQVILGAILLDNALYVHAQTLEADDFSLDSNRRIYLRMAELLSVSVAVDLVTLSELLRASKELAEVGGVAYLASLTEGLPRRLEISEYVRIVKEKSQLRKLLSLSEQIQAQVYDQQVSSIDIGRSSMKMLMQLFGKPGV